MNAIDPDDFRDHSDQWHARAERSLAMSKFDAPPSPDRPCWTCNGQGTRRCRRCGGTGNPPQPLSGRARMNGHEKRSGHCQQCLGNGTVTCGYCGGAKVIPPAKVLG